MKYWKEAGVNKKIDLRINEGKKGLDTLLEDHSNHNVFDFAYIDADKENYPTYYE